MIQLLGHKSFAKAEQNEICLWHMLLTYLPQCHIYVSVSWVNIGSGNGLSPVQRQAITWTSADFLSIEPLRKNFNENWIERQNFSFMKISIKCLKNVQGETC